MQLGRCFTVLAGEAVSRDTEPGNLDIPVLGDGRGGNPGRVVDTGGKKKKKKSINQLRPPYAFLQLGVHDSLHPGVLIPFNIYAHSC